MAAQMNILMMISRELGGWFRKFHHHQCLSALSLYREGGAIDRNDPELLAASLERNYAIVNEYDPSCLFYMDETSANFPFIPRYRMLLPSEGPSTIRGKKKLLD